MAALLLFILGIVLGYYFGCKNTKTTTTQPTRRPITPITHQQKLLMKSVHQSDSDRIRELNRLSSNQSVFLRLLKQTFPKHEIAIKQRRFIVLDADHLPCAIFEYRDGTQPMKVVDREDGLPLHLYKGLISSDELKQDYLNINKS